jgi:hypothetical protein
MRFVAAVILALMLVVCGGGGASAPPLPPVVYPGPPGPPGISMDVTHWWVGFSVGAPATPTQAGSGWYVDIPVATGADTGPTCKSRATCPHLNMIALNPGAAISGTVTLKVQVDTTGTPVFNYNLDGTETCNNPARISLYFQRGGDDYSAVGEKEFYRWWSNDQLVIGSGTLSVALQPQNWFSVYGKNGSTNPALFAAALASPRALGMTFGGGCTGHHGVNVSGGTARFNALNFVVQ